MSSILRVDQILNTNGSSEITLGKVNHTDTTDASVPSAASIYTPGGIAALKDLNVGTTITVGGNIILSDTSILVGKASVADISTGTNDTKFVTPLSLASSGIIPAGALISYAGSTAPTGWLLCDGTAISRTTYANLFSAIGTTWGVGDGSTTFNIPNGQGVGITGAGTQNVNARAKGGNSLGETVEDTMQGHYHEIPFRLGTNSTNNDALYWTGQSDSTLIGSRALAASPMSDGTNGTPRTGAETTISSIVANFIIKY